MPDDSRGCNKMYDLPTYFLNSCIMAMGARKEDGNVRVVLEKIRLRFVSVGKPLSHMLVNYHHQILVGWGGAELIPFFRLLFTELRSD